MAAQTAPEVASQTVGALVDDVAALVGTRAAARDLLAALLDQPRSWPALHATEAVLPEIAERARFAARTLSSGTPFAYAVGKTTFRHLTLGVDPRVLIPRPETEVLVDLVLSECRTGTVVDLGTGSGAIALALATEGNFDRVIGTDLSEDALTVAAANANALGASNRIEWRQGSWVAPVRGLTAQAVVSNPPYISHDEAATLDASVRDWEPPVALFADEGGMAAIRSIVRSSPEVLVAGGLLAMEVDERRASLAAELARSDGRYRDVRIRLDLTGRERFVLARYIGSHDDT